MNTKKITLIGVSSALYIVLTVMLGEFSYGPIQFRISEILNLLALIHPIYIFAIGFGCAVSNLYSFGLIDVFVGSISTMIAMTLVYKFRSKPIVASIFPTIMIFPIALELNIIADLPLVPTFLGMALSEFVVVTVIGVPVFKMIMKNKKVMDILSMK